MHTNRASQQHTQECSTVPGDAGHQRQKTSTDFDGGDEHAKPLGISPGGASAERSRVKKLYHAKAN